MLVHSPCPPVHYGRNGIGSSTSSSGSIDQQQQQQQQQQPLASSAAQEQPQAPPPQLQQQHQDPQQLQQQEELARLQSGSPVEELLKMSLADEEAPADAADGGAGAWAGAVGVLGGIVLLMGGGYIFREPIKHFLNFFIDAVDEWGAWGYVAYALVYTGLEVGG